MQSLRIGVCTLRLCRQLRRHSARPSGVRQVYSSPAPLSSTPDVNLVPQTVETDRDVAEDVTMAPAHAWPQLRKDKPLDSALYLVSTPIGNLEDITIRALNVLAQADTILAEDCRHSRKLLNHYGIHGDLVSYHMHNENERAAEIACWLAQGRVLALISDAGTPGISDPGSRAVTAALAAGHKVVPVPGACAAIAALVASGMPTDSFLFVGFLPPKKGARRAALDQLRQSTSATMVFYVPPHGLLSTLEDMVAVLGPERDCCVTRELTKVYETFHRDSLTGALQHYTEAGVRGEIALLVRGSTAEEMAQGTAAPATPEERIRELLATGSSVAEVSKQVGKEFSLRKKDMYAQAVALQLAAKSDTAGDAV